MRESIKLHKYFKTQSNKVLYRQKFQITQKHIDLTNVPKLSARSEKHFTTIYKKIQLYSTKDIKKLEREK
jgi:hypothetical protein